MFEAEHIKDCYKHFVLQTFCRFLQTFCRFLGEVTSGSHAKEKLLKQATGIKELVIKMPFFKKCF